MSITVPENVKLYINAIKNKTEAPEAGHREYERWLKTFNQGLWPLYEDNKPFALETHLDNTTDYVSFGFIAPDSLPAERVELMIELAVALAHAQGQRFLSIRPRNGEESRQQVFIHSDGTAMLRWNQGGRDLHDPNGSLSELKGTHEQIFNVLRTFA